VVAATTDTSLVSRRANLGDCVAHGLSQETATGASPRQVSHGASWCRTVAALRRRVRKGGVFLLSGILLAGCATVNLFDSGATVSLRFEIWENWETIDGKGSPCQGTAGTTYEASREGGEVAIIDSTGTVLSRAKIGSGYIDWSYHSRDPQKAPDRVCAWDVRFLSVPTTAISYRILWPDGDASVSYSARELADRDWNFGTWTGPKDWTPEDSTD
jgi:hypothetical protein